MSSLSEQRIKELGQILIWLREGYSYASIARKMGLTRQRVQQLAKKYELPKPLGKELK